MRGSSKLVRLFGSITSVAALLAASSTWAASDIWVGSTDGTWATSANWLTAPATVPGTGDIATFNGAGNGFTTISLGSGVTISNIFFDTASVAAYTIGSGVVGSQTLTLAQTNGGISLSSSVAANQLFNANLGFDNPAYSTNICPFTVINDSAANSLTLAGGLSASTPGIKVIKVDGVGNTIISGLISSGTGTMNLEKTNSGTLTLSGGATFSGNGVNGYLPGTTLAPVVLRQGATRITGGNYTNNGEFIIGGAIANGGAGNNASLTMDGGYLRIPNWLSLGRGNGIGGVSSDIVLNNGASIVADNFSAGYNGGNSTNLPKGTFKLNNTSSFSITGNGNFYIGESAGSDMTMTLSNSAQVVASGTGAHRIGGGGNGTLNINDTASVSFGNATAYIGYRTGSGVLNSTGGTFTNAWGTTTSFRVGGSDVNGTAYNATGTLNIANATAWVGALNVARGNNNQNTVSGIVNINSGGTLNTEGDVQLGFAGSNNLGSIVINGGTLNVATTTKRWVIMSQWDSARAQIDVNSGLMRINANTDIRFSTGNNQTGSNVFNLNGGAVTFYADNATTVGGSGVIDLQQSGTASSINTFNLNGGTLTVPQILCATANGTRIFNFNGGTLKPTTSSTAFMNLGAGATRANVRNGGAIIDSNGKDITIATALAHSDVAGDAAIDGGLTKNGSGTLTLSAPPTYTGPTVINGGGLAVPQFTTLAAITLGTAAGLGVDASGGSTLTTSGLTIQDNCSLAFNYGTIPSGSPNPSTPAIMVNGTFSAPGANIVINISGFGLQIGSLPLISFTAGAPSLANFTLGSLPPGLQATLTSTATSINLNITSTGQNLAWYGLLPDGVNVSSNWDISLTTNWVSLGTISPALRYQQYSSAGTTVGDPVRFDDFLYNDFINPPPTNIWVAANVVPFTVTVDSTLPYSFTGPGGIGGLGYLVKSNTGSLTLSTSNSYSGGTFIYGGSIIVGNDTGLGAASRPVTLGATLDYEGNATNNRPFTLVSDSILNVGSGFTIQLGGTIGGNYRLNFDGTGAKVLTNLATSMIHVRGGALIVSGNGRVTNNVNWTSIAPYYDDTAPAANAQVILRDNAVFEMGNLDFNVSDATVAGPGATARLDIQNNALLRAGRVWIGKGLNATGMVYQTGGIWTNHLTAGGDIRIGGNATDQTSAWGAYNLSGGRVDIQKNFQVGAYGYGELNIGGTGIFNSWAGFPSIGRFTGSVGVLNVSGGQFNQLNTGTYLVVGENGTGTLNLSGAGTVNLTNSLGIGGATSGGIGDGTVNLNGGRLITPGINMPNPLGSAVVNFNGGTIQANASSSSFMQGLTAVNLLAGGGTVDCSNYNITIGQGLVGIGGLTKVGSGTLTLSGGNTYGGTTLVNAGRLIITPAHHAAGAVTVADGAGFGVLVNAAGAANIGNLAIGTAGTNNLDFILNTGSNPGSPVLQAGTITVNGTCAIRLNGALAVGTFPVLQYGTLVGAFNLAVSGPQGMVGSVSNYVAGKTLYVTVTSLGSGLVWTGTNSAAGLTSLWDLNSTTNWLVGSTPTYYQEFFPPGDRVNFTDVGNGSVILNTTVNPSSVTFNNSSINYSLSGTGRVAGITGITKQGSGTVMIGWSGSDYTGDTVVNGGTLQLGSATAIPNSSSAGTVRLGSAGTLDLNGYSQTINGLSGTGRVDNSSSAATTLTVGNGGASSTWAGTIDNSGSGGISITKLNSGTLTISGANYLRNGTASQINGGTLVITNGGAVSTVGGEFWIAQGPNTATVIVDGGSLVSSNWIVVGRNSSLANGTMIVNSGTVQKTGANNLVVGSLGATGTLIVNGGQVLNNGNLWLGESANANGTLHLNGGLIQATQIRYNGDAPATSAAYFNGGTLQATAGSTNFFGLGTMVYIESGGLVFDDGGFAITNATQLWQDAGGGGVVKQGSGALYLDTPNSYLGTTLVANGTLAGIGSIAGPVVVAPLGNLGAGDAGTNVGMLTIYNTLTLQGQVTLRIDKTAGVLSSDFIIGATTVNYGGKLAITRLGTDALVAGDTFTLFSAGAPTGNFTSIVGSPGTGLGYSFDPTNGVLSVVTATLASNPTNITVSISGSILTLSWPADHLGWILQAQTNSINIGLSTNWVDVAGSDSITGTNITINPAAGAAFYRLRRP